MIELALWGTYYILIAYIVYVVCRLVWEEIK